MHAILDRQLKKSLGTVDLKTLPPNWVFLLQSVSDTYTHFDEDRALTERSLEISSKELEENNASLREENKIREARAQELENSKSAMLNLLEDAKELEEQLKVEKESVERKIEARTQELSEEKIKLSASINSLTLGFIMADENKVILNMNKAATDILDISVTDTNIQTVQEQLSNKLDIESYMTKCLATHTAVELKDVAFGAKILHIFIAPIVIEDNSVIGVVILVEDITEAKMLERSRDEFFSIASHELRTPLTAIKGNTSMILEMYADKLTDPDLKQMIDDIHDGSVRLITIVNDFLNVSRLELGKMVFKKEAFDMPEFITSTMKDVQHLADEKKIGLTFNAPTSTLPKVFADRDRLKEVLINLISNSVKFSDAGGVTVEAAQIDNHVKVSVTDTGKGIPIANQGLLFRKFQQASNNILTRDTTRSTGLGLYIAKLIMEGMGGSIQLDRSEQDKGSTFSFTLPVATQADIAPAAEKTMPVVASV